TPIHQSDVARILSLQTTAPGLVATYGYSEVSGDALQIRNRAALTPVLENALCLALQAKLDERRVIQLLAWLQGLPTLSEDSYAPTRGMIADPRSQVRNAAAECATRQFEPGRPESDQAVELILAHCFAPLPFPGMGGLGPGGAISAMDFTRQ